MAQIFPFRKSTPAAVHISPLASWDRTTEAYTLAKRFALRPADHRHVLGRELTLALGVHGKVRVARGILVRSLTGGGWTLTDTDGCQVASVDPSTIVGWSADPIIERLEVSTLKALRVLRAEAHEKLAREWAAGIVASNYAMAAWRHDDDAPYVSTFSARQHLEERRQHHGQHHPLRLHYSGRGRGHHRI